MGYDYEQAEDAFYEAGGHFHPVTREPVMPGYRRGLESGRHVKLPTQALRVRRQDILEAEEVLQDGQVIAVHVDGMDKPVTRQNIQEIKEQHMQGSHMDPEFLRSEAEKMLMRATILESVPQNDEFDDGQILYFTKTFGAQIYHYAAIRTGGLWFCSGSKAPHGIMWNEFIGVKNLPTVEVVLVKESLLKHVQTKKVELEEK
jgi:hypothetical protein